MFRINFSTVKHSGSIDPNTRTTIVFTKNVHLLLDRSYIIFICSLDPWKGVGWCMVYIYTSRFVFRKYCQFKGKEVGKKI